MSDSASSGGIGMTGALFLIFLTLKLAEIGSIATWSWWWVCSPLWIPLALILPISFGIYAFATIGEWLERRRYLKKMMD